MIDEKWDLRFLEMAKLVASWSKDPSTKCGAVITRGKQIVSSGFNGFPQGVDDTLERLHNRELKYAMVLHAEVNALNFAFQDLSGCSIYVYPMPPCSRCAAQIIQRGITRVVAVRPTKEMYERWGNDIKIANQMYSESGVDLTLFEI